MIWLQRLCLIWWLTFSKMMSISEYFIPFTRMGMSLYGNTLTSDHLTRVQKKKPNRDQRLNLCVVSAQMCVWWWWPAVLTGPGVLKEPLYRWAAPLESARTRTPPAPRSHPRPACAEACTAEKHGWESNLPPIHCKTPRVASDVCMFHLYDAVHVWYQTVDSDLQQHDQSSAHVLPHLAVFITRQRKQRLKKHRWAQPSPQK